MATDNQNQPDSSSSSRGQPGRSAPLLGMILWIVTLVLQVGLPLESYFVLSPIMNACGATGFAQILRFDGVLKQQSLNEGDMRFVTSAASAGQHVYAVRSPSVHGSEKHEIVTADLLTGRTTTRQEESEYGKWLVASDGEHAQILPSDCPVSQVLVVNKTIYGVGLIEEDSVVEDHPPELLWIYEYADGAWTQIGNYLPWPQGSARRYGYCIFNQADCAHAAVWYDWMLFYSSITKQAFADATAPHPSRKNALHRRDERFSLLPGSQWQEVILNKGRIAVLHGVTAKLGGIYPEEILGFWFHGKVLCALRAPDVYQFEFKDVRRLDFIEVADKSNIQITPIRSPIQWGAFSYSYYAGANIAERCCAELP